MPEPIRLSPADLSALLRQFRLPGGRVRRVRVLYPRPKEVAVEFHLSARTAAKPPGADSPVKFVLRVEGVEEFRVQMRPGQPRAKIADARLGYLNGLFFVNLDAWALEPGEQPKLHDYRGSEVYAGGRELFWWKVEPKKPRSSGEPGA